MRHVRSAVALRSPLSKCPQPRLVAVICAAVFLAVPHTAAGQKIAVTTHHYNNFRTGWNNNESVLTPANVGSSAFGVLYSIALDAQVDAQPLLVPNEQITVGNYQGVHDVVYVATEGNTIYAIDADNGTVLLSPNFGAPVPEPTGCPTNPVVGINSTPVIDLSSNTMYVIIYTSESNGPVYRIHALDLGSLSDELTPVVVAASHTLTDGIDLQFQRRLSAAASCATAGKRHRICRLWQLLRQ